MTEEEEEKKWGEGEEGRGEDIGKPGCWKTGVRGHPTHRLGGLPAPGWAAGQA